MSDQVSEFVDFMRASGVGPHDAADIIGDDVKRRFRLQDDKVKVQNGSYALRIEPDGFAFGWCMSFKEGTVHKWHIKTTRKLSDEDRAAFKAKADAAKKARDLKTKADTADAAKRAARIWAERCGKDGTTDYLTRKQVPLNGARIMGDMVVVPLRQGAELKGLQFIKPDGSKMFNKNVGKEGSYFSIATKSDDLSTIYICEGFATGGTIRAAMSAPVIVAFDAGNLKPVAKAIRKKYSDARIVIAGDNDQWTKNQKGEAWNPGVEKAQQAAVAIGGALVVVPQVPSDDEARRTDWNDIAVTDGIEAVREALTAPEYLPRMDDAYADMMSMPDEPDYETAAEWLAQRNAYGSDVSFDQVGEGSARMDVSKPREPVHLQKDDKDRIIENLANVSAILLNREDFEGCFAFDEFAQRKVLNWPLPGTKTPRSTFKWREWRDTDYIELQRWFQMKVMPKVAKGTIMDAVDHAFRENSINSLMQYFKNLPKYDPDKEPRRIKRWLFDYCGVTEPDDAKERDYLEAVAARWMISAAARATRPGCKVDTVLILEGDQGKKKSTAISVLCGADWFGDSLPHVGNKDAMDYVKGKFIIEMSELAGMNKAEIEDTKAFLSRSSEKYRPAYGREEVVYPRQCVFVGTTNKSDYLRDETGNRRFWPVRIDGTIKIENLRRDRDLLWAEALHWLEAGKPWWMTEDVEITAANMTRQRLEVDPWHDLINNRCSGRSEITIREILNDVINVPKSQQSRSESNRVSSVLMGLGFTRGKQVSAGEYKGSLLYTRAIDEQELPFTDQPDWSNEPIQEGDFR